MPIRSVSPTGAAVILALLTMAFAMCTGLDLGGRDTTVYVDDLATIGAALLATAACGRMAWLSGGRARRFWSVLTAALGLWMLGEMIWAVYDIGGRTMPDVTWADAAYLAAVPVAATALLLHPELRGRAVGKTRSLIDGTALAASLFFLAWALVFEPVHREVALTSLAGVVTFAYPLGDVVIVFLVVLVIRGTTARERHDLWWLLAGLLAMAFSDSVYTYLATVRDYASGHLLDTGWFAGYLAIALAALHAHVSPIQDRAPAQGQFLTPAALLAPFVPLFAALGFAAVWIQLGHRLDRVSLVIGFVLVALVLARQLLLALDIRRLETPQAPIGQRLVAALGETAPANAARRGRR